MKRYLFLFISVVGAIAFAIIFAVGLNLIKTKEYIDNKNSTFVEKNKINFYSTFELDFNKTFFIYLKKTANFYNKIYHVPVYSLILDKNKIIALYDGNETNQTILLNKFKQIFIPNTLFLKPFQKIYQDTKDTNLKNFIDKYKNKKIAFIKAVCIYENLDRFLDKDISENLRSYLFPIIDKQIIFGKNSQLIIKKEFFNIAYYYIKRNLSKKNKKNFSITPVLLKVKLDLLKDNFYNAVLSSVPIYNCFPKLTTNNLEFDDKFRINILLNLPAKKLYFTGYGINFFSDKLLSLDFFYDVVGCSMKHNNCYYFKTFNINLVNFKYLNLNDFFDRNYINNYLLKTLYKKITENYKIKISKNKLYKTIINKFTIDKKFLYFYFSLDKIFDDYYIIKIRYDCKKLKFNF